MKTLKSVALYALLAPAITLSAGSLLAQQPGTQTPGGAQQQGTQQHDTQPGADRDRTERDSTLGSQRDSQAGSQRETQAGSQRDDRPGAAQAGRSQREMSEPYLSSAPQGALHGERIMGANLHTTGDEDIGSINDLIFDEEGRIVAVVVGVGGFLGMGEKAVAINWDNVTRDPQNPDRLRVNATEEELRSAPEFRDARD